MPPVPLQPPTPLQLIPLPYSALLHTLLAPEELTAVDTLRGPWPPAMPMGTQWVTDQALETCSEEKSSRQTECLERLGSKEKGYEHGSGLKG